MGGWTTCKILRCESGQCGWCQQCNHGLIPSKKIAQQQAERAAREAREARCEEQLDEMRTALEQAHATHPNPPLPYPGKGQPLLCSPGTWAAPDRPTCPNCGGISRQRGNNSPTRRRPMQPSRHLEQINAGMCCGYIILSGLYYVFRVRCVFFSSHVSPRRPQSKHVDVLSYRTYHLHLAVVVPLMVYCVALVAAVAAVAAT